MNRIESLLAKLCISIVSVVICLLVVELAARFYLWHIASEKDFRVLASINQIKDRYGDDLLISRLDHRNLSWSPHHYLGYYPTPNFRRGENKHNSLGFRGDEISVTKPEHTYRIVTVGGSTTYSIDVLNYQHSYPYLLGEYLQASGYKDVEVINAGVAAHTSFHNLMNLEFRVLPLDPDLIIIYQGFNDIHTRFVYPNSLYSGDNSGYEAQYVSDVVMPQIVEYSTALRILGIRAGFTESHAALDWHHRGRASNNYAKLFQQQVDRGIYPSDIFEQVSAMDMLENNPPVHFERNVQNMLAIAERHDIDVLLVTVVLIDDFHQRTGSKMNTGFSSEEFQYAMAQHNDVTRKVATTPDSTLLDLAEIFPDEPALFSDGLHTGLEGNRIRAQLVGDFVIREFLST